MGDVSWMRFQKRDTVRCETYERLPQLLQSARLAVDPEAHNVTHNGNLSTEIGMFFRFFVLFFAVSLASNAFVFGEGVNLDVLIVIGAGLPVVGSGYALRGVCCDNNCSAWDSAAHAYPTSTDFSRKILRMYTDEHRWMEVKRLQVSSPSEYAARVFACVK